MNAETDEPIEVLVIQTAFPGDVVLTLPLIQQISAQIPHSQIDILVTPVSADIPKNHPAIRSIIEYDKHGIDAGVTGFSKMLRQIRANRYAIALIPHRSFRSALLPFLAGIPVRVGFDRSAGWFLFTRVVQYDKDVHESRRNCKLLNGLGVQFEDKSKARLYPGEKEKRNVDLFLSENAIGPSDRFISVAPGSAWKTKRWPDYYFAEAIKLIRTDGWKVVLIGGERDAPLCEQVMRMGGVAGVANSAGKLTFLESAELIGRSKLLLTNDSAPLHLANAVGTPVAAIFGPTITGFGFGPTGRHDRVLEIDQLPCRPCAIHGGDSCPIGSFPCMLTLRPVVVVDAIKEILRSAESA